MARQIARNAEANGWTCLCPRYISALVLATSDLLPNLPLPLNTHIGITRLSEVENKELNFQSYLWPDFCFSPMLLHEVRRSFLKEFLPLSPRVGEILWLNLGQ